MSGHSICLDAISQLARQQVILQNENLEDAVADLTPDSIIDFWFSDDVSEKHFDKDPDFDQLCRDQFLDSYEAARAGNLPTWNDTPVGMLALVIILDQFPRNMFRDTPKAFETDDMAVQIAENAIAMGKDQVLSIDHRKFLFMPFMHSEDLVVQEHSVARFQTLGLEDNIKYAIAHRDVIARFGRFPHRNAILGRESTDAEREYLAQPGAGF